MSNFRLERIEKLLNEIRYEVERGFMGNEIDESIQFRFVFPVSHAIPDGVILCEFRTRPIPRHQVMSFDVALEPKLRIVK